MKSKEYWEQRAEQNILNSEKNAMETAKRVEKLYKETMKAIESEINRFYARFALKQDLSLAEVKKLLDPDELKSFKEQAEEYYKEAYENNWETAYTKKMRLLSARAYMSRLEELKFNIYHELQRLYQYELEQFTDGLEKQYSESFERTMYDYQSGIGYGSAFTMPNTDAIQKALNTKFMAENYSGRIWNDRDSLVRILDEEIPRAFTLGENPNKTAKRIQEKIEPRFKERRRGDRTLTSKCQRIARTEFNHIANEASYEATTELNKSMSLGIEEYQYLATLDYRTSEICRSLDLKKFPLKEKQVGVNFPPAHISCRSTYTMVIDEEEVTERIAKDKTGKYYYVPSDMTYKEWQEKYNS